MSKKRDDIDERALKGLVPWSLKEFNWVSEQFVKEKRKGHFGPPEFILGPIFLGRYSDRVEFMAHFYRHRQIINFLDKYKDQLVKDGFSGDDGGGMGFIGALIDSLCVLPFVQNTDKNGDEYTFSYKEVKEATRKKLDAHLN